RAGTAARAGGAHRGAQGQEAGGSEVSEPASAEALVKILADAKERLALANASLVEAEQRTRGLDGACAFQGRRGLQVRQSAREAFAGEMARTNDALERATLALQADETSPAMLREIHRELRYLHHSFGGHELPLSPLILEVERALAKQTRGVSSL